MMHLILTIVQFIAVIGIVSSTLYYLLCLRSAIIFLRQRKTGEVSRTQALPPVSILKPLKGIDPEIYESFRSHCQQDYPEYEIIFGVSDPHDAAIESVKALKREFPDRRIQLVVSPVILGANVKVSNLAQMIAEARHDCLIVNDSDIRVQPDYLRRVIAPLADPNVGMVTCLYRGVAAATLGSRLEALGISTDFCAGVLAARQLESGIRFGLGSTLAFRRVELEKIGGFASIVNHLADDYELGKRIADLGLAVKLSEVVVETYLPAYSLRDFFGHQLRWARGVRDARAGGYFGLAFTFGILWALLAVVASREAFWALGALASTLFLRFAVALVVGWKVLRDRQLFSYGWMIPLRDLIAVVVWIVSLGGHTVTWRGDRFELKDGKLTRFAR
ncbi:MAG TPA: bacteriohopanetetrol glucosamine biosynthesis glycosyltransferase HpnI [Candidatus Sulfotelmatobacter sp.]|jgi:ceramide glucosyltransferase|nr:bacteriohopanetetrol glucosamine biosynthesis glycosyltransferase HpnI [Candidatus Sulfotelmatobacter sp.]